MIFPGEFCRKTGIYRVTHWQHRFSHDVIVEEGTMFPQCKVCGVRVRYDIVAEPRGRSEATQIKEDDDFRDRAATA